MNTHIYSLDLKHNDEKVPFAIRTMEEIDQHQGGIADDPHRHNYYTIIWPYSGSGRHIIDFREYNIVPDQIFFVNPMQVHQVITNPGPTGVVILFTSEFLEKNSIREDFIANLRLFRTSDETPPLSITEKMKENLRIFADQMLQAFHSDNDMRFESIGAYLKLFLIECNNHCSLYPGNNPQSIEVGRSLVRRFKQLVDLHFRTWHQVKEYAASLSVTPNYLNEIIKSTLDQSAKEYIQNRIALEAKRMSLFTSKSIKEIGYDLGFEDPSHFSKFYKTYTGQSLQEFKEKNLVL